MRARERVKVKPKSRNQAQVKDYVGRRLSRSQRLPTHPLSQRQELLVAGLTVPPQTPLRVQSASVRHLNGPGGEYGGIGGDGGTGGQPGFPGCAPTEPDTLPLKGSPVGVDEAAFRKQGPARVADPSNVQKWQALYPEQRSQHAAQSTTVTSNLEDSMAWWDNQAVECELCWAVVRAAVCVCVCVIVVCGGEGGRTCYPR